MPSQSSLDGESTPDQWIVTLSPDLGIVFGVAEIETGEEDDCEVNKKKRAKQIDSGFREIIIFLG